MSDERTIVVTYGPTSLRAGRPDASSARADATALRRAADIIDGWADRDESSPDTEGGADRG